MSIIIRRNQALIDEANLNRLIEAKALAQGQVNKLVGIVRTRFITDVPAQQMIYQAKEAEAVSYLASVDPDLGEYPFINAEVGILAATPYEVASIWVGMSRHWRMVAASLEAARMKALNAIEAAHTQEGIDAALDALQTALDEY